MSSTVVSTEDSIRKPIIRISILSAAVFGFLVWILFFRGSSDQANPDALAFLPAVNATLNALCAACILCGIVAIKSGRKKLHIGFMISAISFSAIFLASYITYHTLHGDTKFLAEGAIRYLYFGILISHIACTVFALPLIFSAVFFAATKRFELHKKVVRYTIPLWLYVSTTGVLIYFLLKGNS